MVTAGKDYGPFAIPINRLPIVLPANQTRVDFGIPISEDSVVEYMESLTVRLESADSQVTIGGVANTVVYIEDNDGEQCSLFTLYHRNQGTIQFSMQENFCDFWSSEVKISLLKV